MRDERAYRSACVAVFAAICLACAAPQPREPRRPPEPRDRYEFSWQVPQERSNPAGLTVAVVRPFYADQDSNLSEPCYKKVAKGFAKSMAVDLDKVLVAKGIRVSGPFDTWDDITYPDKQSADLALTPRVFLTMQVKYGADRSSGGGGTARGKKATKGGRGGMLGVGDARKQGGEKIVENDGAVDFVERPVHLTVQGFIAFELREPLSNQKLWVKKLELDTAEVNAVECYEAEPIMSAEGHVYGYRSGKLLFDGKQEAIADLLETWYPMIMEKAWTYLHVEEMVNMKPQVEEIRKNKRY